MAHVKKSKNEKEVKNESLKQGGAARAPSAKERRDEQRTKGQEQ